MAQFTNDLTGGSVPKQLIRFCLPFLLSNTIQALYNVADMLIVSRFAGSAAMSGVANGGQLTFVVTNLVIGLAVGGTVLIGQYFGLKRYEDMKNTVSTLLTTLSLAALVLTVLMIAAAPLLLRAMQVPPEAFDHAQAYFTACMTGTFFIFGYNAISAVLRGMGDSKRPLIFVSIACVANILLDLWFVGGLSMGAAGAAWATVISQALSVALAVVYLKRNQFMFDFHPRSFRIHQDKLRLLLKIGMPNSLQNLVVSLSFLVMMALVNGYGVFASAAVAVVGKFNSFAILPPIAMSAAVSSMAAQNIGAGLPDRAKKTMTTGMLVVLPVGLAFFALAQLAPEAILRIFTSEEPVIAAGIQYLRIFSFDYLVVPFVFSVNGLLTGAGHTTITMISGMLSSLLLRIPFALLFGAKLGLGLTGIGIAAPAASLGALAISLCYLWTGRWKKSSIHRFIAE